MFKKIVVALDGSSHAGKALEVAIGLANSFSARLVLAHAVSEAPLTDEERILAETEYHERMVQDPASLAARRDLDPDLLRTFPLIQQAYTETTQRVRGLLARQMLDNASRHASEHGVKTVETCAQSGDPAEVIIEVAKAEGADLIVMGSRGLSDLQGLLMGSTSHKVAHLAPCSCITVK